MKELSHTQDYQGRFYFGMIFAVWVIVAFYAAFFAYYKAWGACIVMLVGFFIIEPLCLFFNYRKYHIVSRLIYNTSSALYVFLVGLCFKFEASSQYYYSCVVIGAMLIFPKENKKSIIFAVMISFFLWMGSKALSLEHIPPILFAKDAPIQIISHLNHIGSFLLTLVFIFMYVQTIGHLKDETVAMSDLIMRTEQNANIGSWSYEVKRNKLTWSDQTYRIHEEEIGKEVNLRDGVNYYHPDYREKMSQSLNRAISEGIPFDDVFKFISAKNDEIWIRTRARVIKDEAGVIEKVEGSSQNITEEMKAQIAKDKFLATVGHEMRTPLMSVIGLSDLLYESDLNESQRELTQSIVDGGQAVLTIINDILDFSKIKNNLLSLKPKNMDLAELTKNTCNFFKQQARLKGINLECDIDLKNQYILCDQVRMRQILMNLISNAIKFTDEGEVRVLIEELEMKDKSSTYVFTISDTGCGMSETFLPRVFDEFLQDDQNGNVKVGTGLGMSITKRLVDLMKGKIIVESEQGKGTRTFCRIKFEHGEIIEKQDENKQDIDLSHLHILYADDNKMNQKIVGKLLASTKCKITFKNDGKELLDEYCDNQSFDLILVDIQMPVMDGLSSTKKIREFEKSLNLERIPIIAFSAFTFDRDIQKARNAGCQDYLTKPVRKKELIQKISNWQREKRSVA